MSKLPLLALTLTLLLGGCAAIGDIRLPPALGGATPAQERLAEGVERYEKGDFNAAVQVLGAPEFEGFDTETRIEASKYLAFSYCVTQRRTLCRRSFDAILRLDPGYELKPAEAGHPLWGPVFVQARKAAARRTH